MSDARLMSVGQRWAYFEVPSKSQPGTQHTVAIKNDTGEGWCTCAHVPFRVRKAGVREKTDLLGRTVRKYAVGGPGTCRHIKIAQQEAKARKNGI